MPPDGFLGSLIMQDLLWPTIHLAVGLGLLIAGGELLVRGASRLAVRFGIRPLVVGLTVVAFATSAPELAVSVQAVHSGSGDLAVGNLVGSNIANVLLILGLSALMAPLAVSIRVIRIDVPLVIGASILLLVLGMDRVISAGEGLLMAGLLTGYVIWSLSAASERPDPDQDTASEAEQAGGSAVGDGLLILFGLGLLALGGNWLVQGAVEIARLFGVQELVVGLTLIAVGTSLPELVTSVIAMLRGARDMAVGNVLGSNLFNILGVLAITGILSPDGLPVPSVALSLDIPVMIAAAVACLPIFFTGHRIARWEGGLFCGYYLAYTVYLVLDAMDHGAEDEFVWVMALFVLPLTLLTLVVCSFRAWREKARQAVDRVPLDTAPPRAV